MISHSIFSAVLSRIPAWSQHKLSELEAAIRNNKAPPVCAELYTAVGQTLAGLQNGTLVNVHMIDTRGFLAMLEMASPRPGLMHAEGCPC